MLEFFINGGYFMWLLLILAVVIIVLSIKKAIELLSKNDLNQATLESGINAIIFWGGICLVLGFFGHFLGLYNAMKAIDKATS